MRFKYLLNIKKRYFILQLETAFIKNNKLKYNINKVKIKFSRRKMHNIEI